MKELLLLNPEQATPEEAAEYKKREAARAVVVDAEGNIALLHVANDGYYKLPGGGIEEGEDKLVALARECKEEIGCEVDVLGEVGVIVEHRKFCTLHQTSYCYAARVKGEKGEPDFTEGEINDGFELVWVSYDDAIRLIEESARTARNTEGMDYIVPRDTTFLRAAREMI
jgi:8-oxo-dGTP diphosphatase